MKIKQVNSGLAEPVNDLLPKLQKNDIKTKSTDAFEILLSLFSNGLSSSAINNENVPSIEENREFYKNTEINNFFKELIKNIDANTSDEIKQSGIEIKSNSTFLVNTKQIYEDLIALKNLSQQKSAINQKIANIIVNSLPKEIINFLKDETSQLNLTTQDELIQISRIFQKINSKNSVDNVEDTVVSKVLLGKELIPHQIESLKDYKGLEIIESSKEIVDSNKRALTLNQIIKEQNNLIAQKSKGEFLQVNINPTLQKGLPELSQTRITANEEESAVKENKAQNIKSEIKIEDNKSIQADNNQITSKGLPEAPQPRNTANKEESAVKENKAQNIKSEIKIEDNKSIRADNNQVASKGLTGAAEARNPVSEEESEVKENNLQNGKREIEISRDEKNIVSELKSKSGNDFLSPKTTINSQKASNYSMFNSVRNEEIPNYIVRMSNSIKNGGNYRAVMNLKPENLGSIFVNLNIKDDVLNILIKVEMSQTLDKIDSSIAHLKETLVNSGFKSENIHLKIESNQTTEQNYAKNGNGSENQSKEQQKQELREMIQRIRQYEHILSLVKQQEVVE